MVQNILIGVDFSMAKPAATVYENYKHHFYLWPKKINNKNKILLENSNINIFERENIEIKDIVRYDIINSDILSDLIIDSLKFFINKNTIIGFEGSSFGSKGNVTLSLTGWRYILIYKLSKIISLDNIYTFYPMTIKKTAGCSKKGMKKSDMIEAFKKESNSFSKYLRENEKNFKTRKGNWIAHLDDVVDSYWVLETLRKKEKV